MPKLVVQGALLECSMGTSPASFSLAPARRVTGVDAAAGNVEDYTPNVNVPSFGMCRSPTNPQVQAATSAAMGVLTPQPCAPVITAPWAPGSTSVTVGDTPALHDGCTCACQWAGVVTVTSAGQEDIDVY